MEPMFQQLGIAVLLGLLVGLQRERSASGIAGLRTFALITVLGAVSAMISVRVGGSGGWVLGAALLGVMTIIVVGHLIRRWEKGAAPNGGNHGNGRGDRVDQPTASSDASGKSDRPQAADPFPDQPGVTTDVAMLLMFAVGAFLVVGEIPVAVAVGGGVAVLLQFKPELHRIAQKLGDEDLRAIMQFVLITCIILPVLPDQNYGPGSFMRLPPWANDLNVLNPRETWLMVVLIVGLSLSGYIIYKYFGRNAGILLGGLLGGAVSSTATTVSYARSTRSDPLGARTASIVIMIASSVMYLRILLAVAVVSPDFLLTVLAPVGILMALTMVPAMVLWLRARSEPAQMPKQENPTQLVSAVVFGLLYAAVLLALALAQHFWQGRGVYAVAFFSGLTEMDAVTLSTARLAVPGGPVMADGWRIIVVAAMANLVSKSAIAGLLGGWRLMARIAALFAIPAIGGIALLLLL
jgi:uncharacterized membrane protein (DUF4010 family)